jgi:hypothetical protein
MVRTRTTPPVATAVIGAAVALASLVSGCSLHEDVAPRPITHDSLPSVLFQQTQDPLTNPEDPVADAHDIYLQVDETLEAVAVRIPPPNNPDDLPTEIMRKLLQPGLSEESKYKSAIPPSTQLRDVTRKGDYLEIDLSNPPVEGTGQRLAFAQFVFTATAIPGIRGVRFSIDGSPTVVPLDNRASDPGQIITRADYPKLPITAASSTTTTAITAPPLAGGPS